MYIDTHAHLFYPNFKEDIDEVIKRAKESGINYIIVPATDIETAKQTIALTGKYEFIYGAVGVHPHDSTDWESSWIDEIDELLKYPKIVAIGEIGLDYHYDFSPKEKQIEAFRAQIELSIKRNLPIIIHNRDSDEDMMNIIREYYGSGLKAQFHCYSGSLGNARELIKMNHFISFTGNITFKKSDSLLSVLADLSLESIMLETDSPFMTPVPNRGKRNEPYNVKYVAEKIAEVHHLTVEDIARATSYNVFRMFGIGGKPHPSITYKIGNSLYLNITNRCNANCVFCDRKGEAVINGYNLKMSKSKEPDEKAYINEIGDSAKYDEIVFCGYGEPTLRWNIIKTIAKYVKANNGTTRLITNGHGNLLNNGNIIPEMHGLIDTVSISINSVDPAQYSKLMGLEPRYLESTINFAKECKNYVNRVVMSVVMMDEIDIEKVKHTVEEEIGVEFKKRVYF